VCSFQIEKQTVNHLAAGKPASQLFTDQNSTKPVEHADRAVDVARRLFEEMFGQSEADAPRVLISFTLSFDSFLCPHPICFVKIPRAGELTQTNSGEGFRMGELFVHIFFCSDDSGLVTLHV